MNNCVNLLLLNVFYIIGIRVSQIIRKIEIIRDTHQKVSISHKVFAINFSEFGGDLVVPQAGGNLCQESALKMA